MTIAEATVRFSDLRGRLKSVEIRRPGMRPLITGAHAALIALGIVVTSYQAKPSTAGLCERLELACRDGSELDEQQSARARSALLPLALGSEEA